MRAGLVCVGLVACAAGSETIQPGSSGHSTGTTGPTASSTGSGGRGGSGGTGGSAPAGDAIPEGAVSFFGGVACPAGWVPHAGLAGRAGVPTIGSALGGATSGAPLASGEDRTHTHTIHASFVLPGISYAGIAGEANHGVAAAGTAALDMTTDAASTGLPYVQLLACKKLQTAVPGKAPLPSGMLMFFETTGCPEGWQQAGPTQGRLLVGLPAGGKADATFGGAPLDTTAPRAHAHSTDPILVTSPHGIALASGCCAGGYAADGMYQSTQDTDAVDPAFPFVTLLQCQKQ